MIPVRLPMEKHWLLDTIKSNFLRQELQSLSAEERELFQEDNWEEETSRFPKQNNEKDCVVFTCLLAKNMMLTKNSEDMELDDNIRSEMAN